MAMMKEDLRTFVERQPSKILELQQIAALMHDLVSAISCLHKHRMVFRDLRPQNILIDDDGRLKLTHFGVMVDLSGKEPSEAGMVFAAPEVHGRVVNPLSDIWAVGAVFAWLLQTPTERESPLFYGDHAKSILSSMIEVVGRPPSDAIELMAKNLGSSSLVMTAEGREVLNHVTEIPEEKVGCRPLEKVISRATDVELDLLKSLLVFHPQGRISAFEALSNQYFAKYGFDLPSSGEESPRPTEV
eukprot:TRINITY_DN11050_c0_g1_i2.p1 TRINITY_DN11050_c0_g1~~TRINITY_DN11050_c0_g1_i2.p1  ORF type:complete len:244 (+),score=41.52 TRINITY_DN11050_c0_g1_i2:131-862(+)